ncbi:MAG TPA: hypothetical protein VJP02_32020 [Candidatus Sulfotelmatobacter sp.]|nr:hypothetical protein [Candidatus Sulfotelmatobacter sp.]
MKPISNFLAIVLGVFALTVFASTRNQLPSETSDSQNFMNRNLGNLHFDKTTTPLVFSYALIRAKTPGGIVDVTGCAEKPTLVYSVAFENAKLHDVLDAIVKRNPLDRWTVDGGVVNLLPVKNSPALLGTRISQFDSKNATTLSEAASLLAQSPEVEQAEVKLGLNNPFHMQLGLGVARKHGSPIPNSTLPLAVHLENATFMDALNALVRAKGSGVWMYREWHCSANNGYSITFAE